MGEWWRLQVFGPLSPRHVIGVVGVLGEVCVTSCAVQVPLRLSPFGLLRRGLFAH